MMLNTFSRANVVPTDKVPLLEYKFPVTITKPDGVELIDYGKGHSNGKLYFGRGLKLNGVDQSVTLQTAERVGEFTMIATNDTNARYNALSYNVFVYGSTVAFYETLADGSNVYYTHSLESTGTIAVTYKNKTISIYLNGKLEKIFDNLYSLNIYGDRKIGERYGAFTDGVVSNYTYINKALTPDQIAYQYSHPEKFLYTIAEIQEDGSKTYSLHSEILTQEEIDSVVAYLPMCEKDGYVRDMVGYSEVRVSGEVDNAPTNEDEETTYSKDSDDGYSLAVTTVGSNNVRPYLAHSFTSNSSSTVTIVEFDVVVNSGTPILFKMYNGTYSDVFNEELKTGHYKFNIGVGDDSYGYVVQYFDGTKEFDITVTNFRVYSTTANTAITNFTNSCRGEALQLTYGLQTCFLQRDSLGVPSGSSFDRLQCDGVGYVDTGWIPSISRHNYFLIELVVHPINKLEKYYEIAGANSTGGNDRVIVGCSNYGLGTYARVGSYVASYPHNIGSALHYCLEYDNGVVSLTTNGYRVETDSATIDDAVSTFGVGAKLDANNYPILSEIQTNLMYEKFTIHTEKQDSISLFNTYVEVEKRKIHCELIAHRGFAELRPENTMIAFENAVKIGCDAIECDVSITADGVPVVIHDSSVDRTTDGTGEVKDLTLNEIQGLVANAEYDGMYLDARIPTFEEVIIFAKEHNKHVYWEIKNLRTSDDIYLMIDVVKKHNYEDMCVVQCFYFPYLAKVREVDNKTALGYLSSEFNIELVEEALLDNNSVVLPLYRAVLADYELVKYCNEKGLPIGTWTNNTNKDFFKLMTMGVDGVMMNVGLEE